MNYLQKKSKLKSSIFSLFLIMVSSFSFSQVSNIVETEGIKNELQKNNIGKIFFTDKRIGNDVLKQENFLDSYILTNKSNLFFVAYFDNSLTNYNHQLVPNVSLDSLQKNGNYQFALLIDDKEIYRSNLLPGAPQAKNQDNETSLNRPLINNIDGQGSWSESFWNRFLNHGGETILTDGKHKMRMEIRTYVKINEEKVGNIIAAGELLMEVNLHPKIDISKVKLHKISDYKDLTVSKEPFDTRSIKKLKGAIEEGVFKKINSIIVLKKGKLLIEEYFNAEDRSSLHDPRSVGKSFASTLMGIAIDDGYIKDENQQLKEFYQLKDFENFTSEKENSTIRDLLSMSSGFDGNDEDGNSIGNEDNMYPTDNWVKFTLDLPFQNDFKKNWHYFTAGVILLGDIINKSVPGGLEKYADTKLFKPLNITNYEWQYTPQKVPNTAGGIKMTALDFAKYGQLYKNDGVWNTKQIISKEWIKKSFSKQKQIANRNNEFYGFLFWNKTFKSGNKSFEAFYCAGNGGNYILVFKDIPIVIVITASAYGQPYAHTQVTKILEEYVLPAVTNQK